VNGLSKVCVGALGVLILAAYCLAGVASVHSEGIGTIYIHPDGTVEPASAPIQRNGEVFTLTAGVQAQIVLKRGGVVVDGAGYDLRGDGGGDGFTFLCSNATVMNLHISNWNNGVVGSFDNNTIAGNFITNCSVGVGIRALDYKVVGNYVANNFHGIHLGSDHAFVARNNFSDNQYGLIIMYSNHVIAENNIASVKEDILCSWYGKGNQTLYHNNFLNSGAHLLDQSYPPMGNDTDGSVARFDNGYPSGGNYWRDYKGTDVDGDGIGDTSYKVVGVTDGDYFNKLMGASKVVSKYVDRYPLMTPFNINFTLPEAPKPTATLSPTPTASPTPAAATPIETPAASESPNASPLDLQPAIFSAELAIAVAAAAVVVVAIIILLRRKR
jgi:hypothetical protein